MHVYQKQSAHVQRVVAERKKWACLTQVIETQVVDLSVFAILELQSPAGV